MDQLSKRASGVLMHISSLPSPGGIGTLGKEAYSFVNRLKKAHQTYWQILPVGPTGYGDSPYQSFSTFAGNPYFIDLQKLQDDGYIKKSDWKNTFWGDDEHTVNYGLLYSERNKLFLTVQKNFIENPPADYSSFCKKNSFWLDDYALFMAIKDAHNGASFLTWEEKIRRREKDALSQWRVKTEERIEYYKILQYLFFTQWNELKQYANDAGIKIIGDLPIYVAADSADVWANPELFCLDENVTPKEVAGCPPDGFSSDGQLWGNPVYRWEEHSAQNYSWWLRRLSYALGIYDVLRIDHFRGFESFYSIPYGDINAKRGVWKKGPGAELFNKFKEQHGEAAVIAEDLGFLTDEVHAMRKSLGFPGMKILQFAFDSREENDYLPEHYKKNSVAYTGTHDNDTILGWTKTARAEDIQSALAYFGLDDAGLLPHRMMQTAEESSSSTCILTMQDLIGLGSEARMNTPSSLGANWTWRADRGQIRHADWRFLKKITDSSERV